MSEEIHKIKFSATRVTGYIATRGCHECRGAHSRTVLAMWFSDRLCRSKSLWRRMMSNFQLQYYSSVSRLKSVKDVWSILQMIHDAQKGNGLTNHIIYQKEISNTKIVTSSQVLVIFHCLNCLQIDSIIVIEIYNAV